MENAREVLGRADGAGSLEASTCSRAFVAVSNQSKREARKIRAGAAS